MQYMGRLSGWELGCYCGCVTLPVWHQHTRLATWSAWFVLTLCAVNWHQERIATWHSRGAADFCPIGLSPNMHCRPCHRCKACRSCRARASPTTVATSSPRRRVPHCSTWTCRSAIAWRTWGCGRWLRATHCRTCGCASVLVRGWFILKKILVS